MEIIRKLEDSRDTILSYFELSEEELAKSYGPGKWTVREILHHLTDAETVLYDRIRRTISKPHQVCWGFDQDAWAAGLGYKDFPMEINKAIFTSVRQGIIYLAAQHYQTKGHYPFVHNRTGLKDLKHLFDKVVWHGEQHLATIRQALSHPSSP